jgi:hypothetical protein
MKNVLLKLKPKLSEVKVWEDKIIEPTNHSVSPRTVQMLWDDQFSFMKLLQEKRGFPEFPVDITSKVGQQFLEGISFHMMKELFEAGQHLKNAKAHRATEIKEVDMSAYREELVDVLHLFFELVIASGITIDELTETYFAKGRINHDRISNGY